MADLLKFNKEFWTDLAHDEILMIETDADKGIMQNETANHPLSKKYAEMKGRGFRGKKLTRKIKPYDGRQIVSRETRFVNMKLTGETFRNLRNGIKVHPDNLGVTISYAPQDAAKVLGNKARGYDVAGLNKKNMDETFNQLLKQFDENVRKDWAKKITITVG